MALVKRLLSSQTLHRAVSFQIMSDLHLEVGQQYAHFDITPRAPRLILAGDIGRLADYNAFHGFLQTQCHKFEQVYLVLGNHEFFGVARQEGLRLAEKLQQEPGLKDRLIVMNRRRVDLGDDITILGCTLHSRIPPEAEETVRNKVNDFRRIVNWTVADHNAEHATDIEWLADTIRSIRQTEAGAKRRIVVVSHHAPLTKGTSEPSHEDKPWSSAFATDLIGKQQRSSLDEVRWWVFGHTHYCAEFVCGQVKLVSNQRGYVFPDLDKGKGSDTLGRLGSMLLKLLPNNDARGGSFDLEKVIEV